jgi:hypothetical protein
MASPTLQFKRGLFVNLPGLRAGEPGLTTDKSDLFIGIGGTVGDNKFFGSHRYWTRENGTAAAEFKFVDKDGSDGVSLRAPAEVTTPVTYTLPQGGGALGHYLKLGSEGVLEWASVSEGASFDNATLTNTTFAGISTFGGLIDANAGLDVTGGSTFDDINVTGIGTIATVDINGGAIDGTVIGGGVAAEGTFTELAYDNSTTTGISTVGELYVGTTQVLYDDGGLITLAGIQTVDATTIATLEALLALDPNDFNSLNVSGIATIGGLLDANGGLDVFGHTELDDLAVSGVSTFTGAINANGGVVGNVTGDLTGNAGTATSLATARTFEISGDVVATSVSFDGTGNVNLVATIQPDSVALGGDTTGDYVAGVTGTANQISVSGSGGETAAVVLSLPNDVVVGTSLSVPTVKTGAVQASDGANAITISNTTGNVAFASTVTITGDLQVLGSTTTINTETLLVKDPVIDIGLVNNDGDLVAPSAPTATDLALVFHYYDSSAKQSSLYWDHDNENGERFILASTLTGHTVGTATTSVEASAYAALEVGTLWVNNACSGGAQEVIGCNGNSELALMNIVVDAGEF